MKPTAAVQDVDILAAVSMWQETDEPLTFEQYARVLQRTFDVNGHEHEISDEEIMLQVAREVWLWHWADTGFTTLRVSHSYAAALVLSNPPPPTDLILPWRAFRVEVPAGLLDSEELNCRWIYVNFIEGQRAQLAFSSERAGAVHLDRQPDDREMKYRARFGDTLADAFSYTAQEVDWFDGLVPFADRTKDRLMLLCVNLVSGLLYTLQHSQNWTERKHPNHSIARSGPRRAPTHRNVVVGRSIAINLTPEVRALARGGVAGARAAAAMFQSLVRGHFKRQVIGERRAHRKVIWVDPYWRGPEGAPILVRPYNFVGGESGPRAS